MGIENNANKGDQIISRILTYWHQLEFYNPCWPIKSQDIDLSKNTIPWLQPQRNPKIRASYDVYIGQALSRDIIEWMLKELNLQSGDDRVEKDRQKACLCALKIDEKGKYVVGSFALSSFVWAICQLVNAGSFNKKLSLAELDALQQELDNKFSQDYTGEEIAPMSKDDLSSICLLIRTRLNIDVRLIQSTLWASTKVQYANKKGDFPPLDPSTELLPSFFLKDMEKIQKAPTPKINTYVRALLKHDSESHEVKRIEIDRNVEQMQRWLNTNCFPLGIWPSDYTPSLMQQLAINLAISDKQSIFSVNGPPGTGKSTLIKEIVVSNVIQRAIVMATYDKPKEAFTQKCFEFPPDQYSPTFYKPDEALSAYGIIVASHGNTAVENISKELPKAIKKDRTGRFSGVEREIYFTDVATKHMEKPAWGLISAELGRNKNLKKLKENLWWTDKKEKNNSDENNADNNVTLKRYFDEADKGNRPDWKNACKDFSDALQAVRDAQETIEHAKTLMTAEQEARADEMAAQMALDEATAKHSKQEENFQKIKEELSELKEKRDSKKNDIKELKSTLPFRKRFLWWFFKNNSVIQRLLQRKQEVEAISLCISNQEDLYTEAKEILNKLSEECQIFKKNWGDAVAVLQNICKETASYKSLFGENWADTTFWENITEKESSQIACPWTHAEYDRLREELFYQALALHKAFVLSCNPVKQNLMRLFSMWEGNFTKEDCQAAYGDLLNTLLLVIPLISTTFASVQTFLEDVQPEELGMLIIDEAGQATPQSALGAIWRTRKALIVGDPLQIEPIVTIPKELIKRFANENDIPSNYRVPELSVQNLADQLNSYGGFRTVNGEKIWLGCPLIVHRRCIEPMFQISNKVAYEGRMFNKTKSPAPELKFLFEKSVWFDIKGAEIGNKNHAVPGQVHLVVDLFRQAVDIYDGLPKLYIITPFTTVKQALRSRLQPIVKEIIIRETLKENSLARTEPGTEIAESDDKKTNEWLDEHCGTIHTFQGKEEYEVLLVLGCDKASGEGAMKWVGKKPNIINVAVSRAKYRLGIIGDYDIWRNIPYVQETCEYLERSKNL